MGNALHTPGAPGVGAVGPADARLDDAGLIAVQGSGALNTRTGVMHGPGSTALITGTSATAPMTVQVATHHWVTSRGAVDGVYRGAAEAVKTINIAAAPGSGSRTDVVYVKQNDAQSTITPDGTTEPVYGVVSLPTALPVGAEELGRVVVAAGATATNGAGVTISQTARQTVARGASIPVRSKAERDALTTYLGLRVIRLDITGAPEERWVTGTTWRRVDVDPMYVERTSGIVGAAINANSTFTPAGAGLTLPALPIGQLVVIEVTTSFYIESTVQSLRVAPTLTNAARVAGDAGGSSRVSQSALTDSVTTRWTVQITSETAASFGSTYATGLGSSRAILNREDWSAWT